MTVKTFVFSKDSSNIVVALPEITLNSGESIASITTGTPTPVDSSPPVFTISSGLSSIIQGVISGGNLGIDYGIPLLVTTDQRVLSFTIAVGVRESGSNPYYNADPDSYQDLVGELEAGKSALTSTVFQFPASFDPSGGYVTWDLLDSEGTVYSSGNAFEYKVKSTGVNNVVVAKSVINVPADIPLSLSNPYQLRFLCTVGDTNSYSYESLSVVGFPTIELGCSDSIELVGDIATLSLVTEQLYSNYVLELYKGGIKIASMTCANPERVSGGYYVGGSLATDALVVSLIPYQVVWKFWNTPSQTMRETASLFIVNTNIIQAIEDVKSKVNKARQTLYGTSDSQFPSTEIMKWLRRGMDAFNGAYGTFTSFSMINAMGAVREFWLMYAELFALESQYLLEGEKAFNFTGAAISLDVDRTQYLDGMASKIQSRLDAEVKALKQNLVIKGATSGDGSGPYGNGDFSRSTRGAMGTVGILISPASLFGGYLTQYPK